METNTIIPTTLPKVSERTHAWTLEERRAFLHLPLAERQQMLEEMAIDAAQHYSTDYADWEELQGGDIIEY